MSDHSTTPTSSSSSASPSVTATASTSTSSPYTSSSSLTTTKTRIARLSESAIAAYAWLWPLGTVSIADDPINQLKLFNKTFEKGDWMPSSIARRANQLDRFEAVIDTVKSLTDIYNQVPFVTLRDAINSISDDTDADMDSWDMSETRLLEFVHLYAVRFEQYCLRDRTVGRMLMSTYEPPAWATLLVGPSTNPGDTSSHLSIETIRQLLVSEARALRLIVRLLTTRESRAHYFTAFSPFVLEYDNERAWSMDTLENEVKNRQDVELAIARLGHVWAAAHNVFTRITDE